MAGFLLNIGIWVGFVGIVVGGIICATSKKTVAGVIGCVLLTLVALVGFFFIAMMVGFLIPHY